MNAVSTGKELSLTPAFIGNMLRDIAKGVQKGIITKETLRVLGAGLLTAVKLKNHYLSFPSDIKDFEKWCKKADVIWAKVGKMQ